MKPFVRSKKHSLVEDSLTQFLKRLMSLSKNASKKVYLILKKNGNVISMTRDIYLRKNHMRKLKAKKLSLFLQRSGIPWDTLGQPSGKFDYMVKYTAPESSKIAMEDIQPTGWGDSCEYDSQPEEAYQLCQFPQQPEITEGFGFNASAKVYTPEDGYYHINAIFEDEGEDGPAVDSESVAD